MAFELVVDLGAPLLEAIGRRRPGMVRKIELAAEWLREMCEPPPGVTLTTNDGSTYSGVLLIERNRPVAMLAVRQAGSVQPRPPVIPPAPVQRPYYGHDRIDPDAPYWDRDLVPYGR